MWMNSSLVYKPLLVPISAPSSASQLYAPPLPVVLPVPGSYSNGQYHQILVSQRRSVCFSESLPRSGRRVSADQIVSQLQPVGPRLRVMPFVSKHRFFRIYALPGIMGSSGWMCGCTVCFSMSSSILHIDTFHNPVTCFSAQELVSFNYSHRHCLTCVLQVN